MIERGSKRSSWKCVGFNNPKAKTSGDRFSAESVSSISVAALRRTMTGDPCSSLGAGRSLGPPYVGTTCGVYIVMGSGVLCGHPFK